jgi:hypothetical protein
MFLLLMLSCVQNRMDSLASWKHTNSQTCSFQDLAGKDLDRVYTEVQEKVGEAIQLAKKGGRWVMIATDAWKRRVAAGGAILLFVLLLLPTGGSFFLEVLNMAGGVKNADWVAAQHIAMAEKISPGKPEQVLLGNANTAHKYKHIDTVLDCKEEYHTLGHLLVRLLLNT